MELAAAVPAAPPELDDPVGWLAPLVLPLLDPLLPPFDPPLLPFDPPLLPPELPGEVDPFEEGVVELASTTTVPCMKGWIAQW